MSRDTEPAPPPALNPDELEALGERIGAAIKAAVGGPVPELPLRLQGAVGMTLIRTGLEVLFQAGATKAAVVANVMRIVSAYRCPCPECEAARERARCTAKGGTA